MPWEISWDTLDIEHPETKISSGPIQYTLMDKYHHRGSFQSVFDTLAPKAKALVKDLIYEVKYQNSARPGRPSANYPPGFCPPTKGRLGVLDIKIDITHLKLRISFLKPI